MTPRTAEQLSTLFGVGRSKYAPGTMGSIAALPFAWIVLGYAGPYVLFVLSLAAAALGIWASDIYAKHSGKSDPSECVIDELAGQFLACSLAPLSPTGFALAFVLFRLFDIAKFWPISAAEDLPGGYGIVIDDMVAGLFAGVLVAMAAYIGLV